MSSDGPVFRSEDAGRTWELVLGDEASTGGVWLRSVAISPHEEGHLWVAGHTGFLQAILYRSEDHGNSWTHVNPTPDRENAVFMVAEDPDIPERVWAGTEEGVLRSEDAGETWSYVLKHKDASLVQSLLFADGHMFATSHRHGEDPILFQSKNAGETWVRVPVPDSLNGLRSMAIDPEGNLIVGTTGSGVWRVDLRIGEIYYPVNRSLTTVSTRTWPLFADSKFGDLQKFRILMTLPARKAKPVKPKSVIELTTMHYIYIDTNMTQACH